MVMDADSGKIVGDIADTQGVHGIALAPDLGRGFTSNGREGTVSIFDLARSRPSRRSRSATIQTRFFLIPPPSASFTFNGHSHDATAVDASNRRRSWARSRSAASRNSA